MVKVSLQNYLVELDKTDVDSINSGETVNVTIENMLILIKFSPDVDVSATSKSVALKVDA
jgi:hypothetical protein